MKFVFKISITLMSVIGIYLLIIFFLFIVDGACENIVSKTVLSPDKRYKIVLFNRDCGATTRFNSQISLLDKDAILPQDESGNVYIAYGTPKDIEIFWIDNKTVKIVTPKVKEEDIFKKKGSLEGVSFFYEH